MRFLQRGNFLSISERESETRDCKSQRETGHPVIKNFHLLFPICEAGCPRNYPPPPARQASGEEPSHDNDRGGVTRIETT